MVGRPERSNFVTRTLFVRGWAKAEAVIKTGHDQFK